MKMVHGNAVFIREKAKLTRNTHLYTFSTRNFTSFNSVNFPGITLRSLSIKLSTPLAAEIICSRDYDMYIRGTTCKLPIKAGTHAKLKALLFLKE